MPERTPAVGVRFGLPPTFEVLVPINGDQIAALLENVSSKGLDF
jgi:hypothetical protein